MEHVYSLICYVAVDLFTQWQRSRFEHRTVGTVGLILIASAALISYRIRKAIHFRDWPESAFLDTAFALAITDRWLERGGIYFDQHNYVLAYALAIFCLYKTGPGFYNALLLTSLICFGFYYRPPLTNGSSALLYSVVLLYTSISYGRDTSPDRRVPESMLRLSFLCGLCGTILGFWNYDSFSLVSYESSWGELAVVSLYALSEALKLLLVIHCIVRGEVKLSVSLSSIPFVTGILMHGFSAVRVVLSSLFLVGLAGMNFSTTESPPFTIHSRQYRLLFAFVVSFTCLSFLLLGRNRPTAAPAATLPISEEHPIATLMREASEKHSMKTQSSSLSNAVQEYRRRYGRYPPPQFDRWYEYATLRGSRIIDDFDMIIKDLEPFWGVKALDLREMISEAIGFDDNLIGGIQVYNGRAYKIKGDWVVDELIKMMEQFAKYLPDMQIPINQHDEPRVVIPYDDSERLKQFATVHTPPKPVRNEWTFRGTDTETPVNLETRFTRSAHQSCWDFSRQACPPLSPARTDANPAKSIEVLESEAIHGLEDPEYENYYGFLNKSSHEQSVCDQAQLGYQHGIFQRPNAFSGTHYPFPVFSQSKPGEVFADIVFPSPWYWADKVEYHPQRDLEWASKNNTLFWRGSSTGGFSRAGGWRFQHRQRFVRLAEKANEAHVIQRFSQGYNLAMSPVQGLREAFFDCHFSGVGQCDPEDCEAMSAYFDLRRGIEFQESWNYKYLLDIDGNAFSGRYYAFLRSNSAVIKQALFREWHDERMIPWVHFIPLSNSYAEIYAIVDFFLNGGEQGDRLGAQIASQGTSWAQQVLRKEDQEIYLFRQLLEFARILDPKRDEIGYVS